MFKFLINTVLLTALYVAVMTWAGEDSAHWGYVFIAALSALVCSLGSWLLRGSESRVISRDEALRRCTHWPTSKSLRPMPPDGWVWMSSDLYKDPILVSTKGFLTSGDWHDGF